MVVEEMFGRGFVDTNSSSSLSQPSQEAVRQPRLCVGRPPAVTRVTQFWHVTAGSAIAKPDVERLGTCHTGGRPMQVGAGSTRASRVEAA